MSRTYSVKDAAAVLGMTTGQVRGRIIRGELKARKIKARRGQGYEWRVTLNGNEAAPEMRKVAEGTDDPLVSIGNELISLGRRLKRAVREHDAEVRRETIVEFAATLAESVQKKGG
jgi:hypothetical protein